MTATINWSEIFAKPFDKLDRKAIDEIREQIFLTEIDRLSNEELKQFFELSRYILKDTLNANIELNGKRTQQTISDKDNSAENKNFLKNAGDIEESYLVQTIQELNRELAQNVYSKSLADTTDGDSLQPMAIDTKKELFLKIHLKNKYIKRLLCENDALKMEIQQQNEKIVDLNVDLKQTVHKLNRALNELTEQKQQNTLSTDDIATLHTKIIEVRNQMKKIEQDKSKYKTDILFLGEEIRKKIEQWHEILKNKYKTNVDAVADPMAEERVNILAAVPMKMDDDVQMDMEKNRLEINVLSEAVIKRNGIINELEELLTSLTMEIAHSARVINKIVKNLEHRETNFADKLEKLRNHLSNLLVKPNPGIESETQTTADVKSARKSHKKSKKKSRSSSKD